MSLPGETIQWTTRWSAAAAAAVVAMERLVRTIDDLRTSSAAQTKLKATDRRFPGTETGRKVGEPALRLTTFERSSTEKSSCDVGREDVVRVS